MKSPFKDASGGSLQLTLYSTTSKTFKSQRITLRRNFPLPLYPEEMIQTSAPSSPTSLKQGTPLNNGSNMPNLKTSCKTPQILMNGSALAQPSSKKTKMLTTPGQYQHSSIGIMMTSSPHLTNSSISSYESTTFLLPLEQTQSTTGSQKLESGTWKPPTSSSKSKPFPQM